MLLMLINYNIKILRGIDIQKQQQKKRQKNRRYSLKYSIYLMVQSSCLHIAYELMTFHFILSFGVNKIKV